MEPEKKEKQDNPLATANLLSKIFFCWLNPLFRIGYKRRLEENDMYRVLPEDASEQLGEELQWYWNQEVQQAAKDLRPPRLTKALIHWYWKPYLLIGPYIFIEEVIKVIQPVLLGKLIEYFESYDTAQPASVSEAYCCALGISLATIGVALLHHLYFYRVQRAGMKIRVAMCHMIYRKALCLSSSAMAETTTGQIVNLLSNDVNRFDEVGETAVLTDERIRTMSEVISVIRVIKLYGWEEPFSALVDEVRRMEISKIMRSSYLRGLNMASFFVASKIVIFFTVCVYVLTGNRLSASKLFMAVSLYGAKFLLLDEVAPQHLGLSVADKREYMVKVQDLKCYWDKNLEAPTLQKVSFTVRPEQLLVIIGPVGAGKSSLLNAILGELCQETGVVKVKGRVAYTPQQPWILPGTIRSNIVFGHEFNPKKYDRVLRACALKRDIDLLPGGDLVGVGDRGANLSGGQKARVNLARAVYLDADIYLLDDPLSAVDAEVGRHLFEECICGLLRKKPRILITHQLQYLKAADQIVVLKEGQMITRGTYSELQGSGIDFTSLIKEDQEEERQDMTPLPGPGTFHYTLSDNSSMSSLSSSLYSLIDGGDSLTLVGQPIEEESRLEGNVGLSMYVKYFLAGANLLVLLFLILLNGLAQITFVLQDWWLAHWASEQKHTAVTEHLNGNFPQQLDLDLYLGVYAALTGTSVVFGFTRSLVFFKVLVKSAQTLHKNMFRAILRTSIRFFDTNPTGTAVCITYRTAFYLGVPCSEIFRKTEESKHFK